MTRLDAWFDAWCARRRHARADRVARAFLDGRWQS